MELEPRDLIDTVEKRQDCLQVLAIRPQSKRDLVDSVDIPRSTLDDVVRELDQLNLVKYREGQWRLTVFGDYVFKEYITYHNYLEDLISLGPLIEELPSDNPLASDFLAEADAYIATSTVIDDVMQVLLEKIKSSTRVRGFTPVAIASYAEPFYECLTTGSEYELDLILPKNTLEQMEEIHPRHVSEALSGENINIYCNDIPVTFSLWIADKEHAGIIVYAEHGVQGIAINNTTDAVEWAIRQYERVKEDAERISHERNIRTNS